MAGQGTRPYEIHHMIRRAGLYAPPHKAIFIQLNLQLKEYTVIFTVSQGVKCEDTGFS